MSIASFIPSHWSSKLINAAIAPMLFVVSNRLDRLAMYASGYQGTSEAQSHKGYAQWLDASLQPPRREVSIAQPLAPIDAPAPPLALSDIKKALSKPHILVLGETGSGKSTLVKFLVSESSAPAIVLDSHAALDDWQGMNVIGMGRNYAAIGQAVSQLVSFMDTRYQARSNGQKQFEPLLVLIDEFPAAAANLGKAFTDNIMLLVREARKVSIRLIILSQGSEVKTLGIEGQGSIRECFAIVSLGKFATDRAKTLKDAQVKSFIDSAQYPAMLDDLPCELPKIDRVALPSLPLPSDYLGLVADSPDLEPIDRPRNQQSALTAPALTASALSTTNQQSASLSAPLQSIVDYARKQNDFVSARKIQSGIAIFKNAKAPEIREYFKYLATLGYGVTRGESENLEFSAG
ncbi:MAG: helicase HerA domain-containing protein [Pseudanabaena sp.]